MNLRPYIRFARIVVAYAVGAALTYAIGHITDLPLDPIWAAAIGAALNALSKALRDKGILPSKIAV